MTGQAPPDARVGTCDRCGGLRALVDGDGGPVVVVHRIGWQVSSRAVRTVGAGAVARRCPGSGRPPRRVEHGR
jgi:hypothetical protein